jgi:hypothetical protein
MAACPHVILGVILRDSILRVILRLCVPVPNARVKISVPLINSLPGKNCLVPPSYRGDFARQFRVCRIKSREQANVASYLQIRLARPHQNAKT